MTSGLPETTKIAHSDLNTAAEENRGEFESAPFMIILSQKGFHYVVLFTSTTT